MKLLSTIKKCLGLLYIAVLSFSVVGISKTIQVNAVEEYDTGIGMEGTWSLEIPYGQQTEELCFTETSSGTEYFFNALSAIYYSDSSTSDIDCSVYYIDDSNGTHEDVQNLTVTIHLDSVSEPQVNAQNGTYTITGTFPNGSINNVSFTIARSDYEDNPPSGDPHLSNNSDEGYWDYDDSDHVLTWIDPTQQTLYDLDYVSYSVLNHTATLIYEDYYEIGPSKVVELTGASYENENYFTVSGWMILNSVSTEVTINYGAHTLNLVDQWVYSDMELKWVANDGEEHNYSDLSIYTAYFFTSNSQFRVKYLYNDTLLPEVALSSATYQLYSEQGDGYYEIMGYSSTFNGEQGTLNIDKPFLTFISSDTGWVYDSAQQTFIYCVGGAIQTSSLSSGTYCSYGDYYDYAVLTYVSSYNNDTIQEKITVTSASYDDEDDPIIVTGTYNDQAISLKTAADLLDIQFQSRWHNDGESNYFTYWNDLDDECGGTIERVIYNNYAYESVNNECYITIAAYSNDISQEFICRTTLVIYSALIEVDPRVSQDGGMIGGYWTELGHPEKEVHIHVDNIDIENTIGEGWNYMNGFDDFIYQTPQGENCAVYVTSAAFDGRDENNATCTFNYTYESREDGTHTGSFVMKDATIEQEQTGNQQGIISGVWSDFSEDTITVRTPILTMNEDPYWAYNDGYLEYIDPTNSDIETVMVSCIYSIDDECFELDYNLVNNRDGGYDTATIILANAELGRDYNPDAEEPAERSGYISGNCSAIGDTDNYITLIVDVTIQKRGNEPYWSYNDGYLEYVDPSNEKQETIMVSCTFYESTSSFTIEYSITDSATGEFTIVTIELTNGEIERDYDPTGEEPVERSGYISGNCSVLNISDPITLIVDIQITRIPSTLPDPVWVYNDDTYALWWNDPAHEEYQTELEEAYYYDRTESVSFVYSIVTYTSIVQPDAPTVTTGQDAVRTIITQKTVHMNEIDFEDDQEMFIYVTGICVECEEATTLVVPRDKFITATYDEDPGTITPDQQVDIKELLPEETTVDEQRMEESIVAISSETAHEIIVTINDAHEKNEEALSKGEITQEVYIEKKEIIETVTEAAVVVGAGATTASDEGKAVDNALPDDHDLGFTMDETLSEFYQTQMDYLLGKREAPQKSGEESRHILRAGGTQQTYDITNVSKEDYAKMINFVDTAVSNMKDAALQIRKCSASKMKKVVGDYIQVVKVSSFREFDATAAENKFVDAVYKAIMLNMQQQVVEALKRDHKPTNNPEKELLYRQQLEACEDFDTFEELVLEVLRQKYNAISNTAEVGIDEFRDTYRLIFRSWALNKPEENPTPITLEQLTTATIETTKANANRFEYRGSIDNKESLVLIIFGAAAVLGIASAITIPILVSKSKQKRA